MLKPIRSKPWNSCEKNEIFKAKSILKLFSLIKRCSWSVRGSTKKNYATPPPWKSWSDQRLSVRLMTDLVGLQYKRWIVYLEPILRSKYSRKYFFWELFTKLSSSCICCTKTKFKDLFNFTQFEVFFRKCKYFSTYNTFL